MKYALWLFYSFVALGIAYIIPLLTVGEKVEVRKDYLKSFEASNIEDISQIQNEEDAQALQLTLLGVEVLQGAKGKKDWQLNAKWLNYSGNSGDLLANTPELVYYNKSNKNPFRATGTLAKVKENNTKVEIQENVVLKQDSILLSAPLLNFDSNKEIFRLSQNVRLKSPELIGKANTIIWDTKGNSIQAQRNVVFIFNPHNTTYSLNSTVPKPPVPTKRGASNAS